MKNRVKECRIEQNITQEELSELSKVSRQTISDLENQKLDNVGSKIMTRIATALKSKEKDIFFIDDVKKKIQQRSK